MTEIELTFKLRNGDGCERTMSVRQSVEPLLVSIAVGKMLGEAARLAADDEIGHVLQGLSTRLDGPESQVLYELATYLVQAANERRDPRDHIVVDWVAQVGGESGDTTP